MTLDVRAMSLSRGTKRLVLEPKSFRLLVFLVENRDRVLSKDEILRVVWQETAVTDNALTRAIAQIRKALGDDAREPRYIATIATVGYRFIGVLDKAEEPAPEPTLEPALLAIGVLDTAGVPAPEPTPEPAQPARGGLRFPWPAWLVAAVLIVAGIFATFWHSRAKAAAPASSPATYNPIPLTVDPGDEAMPTFSPNGDQVAYAWSGPKAGNYDIYVKTVAADSRPIRLTTDPARDYYPSWSPDGSSIAFLRIEPNGKLDLMLIPALGGPERRLGEFSLGGADLTGYKPAWSADSKWIVVAGGTANGAGLYRVSVESGEASQIVPSRGGFINTSTSPDISPDGKTLAYVERGMGDSGTLWTVHLDNEMKPIGAPQQVPTGGRRFDVVQWTADGNGLIVVANSNIYRMPAAGSDNPELVARRPFYGGVWFAISRRSGRLAYSVVQKDTNIWRVDIKSKTPHPEPLIASTMHDAYPAYSPDGNKVAFYTDRTGPNTEIWLADADGGNQRQLTSMNEGHTDSARWSPDGRTIVFNSNSTGTYQIYTIPADGGKPRQMTSSPENSLCGSFSRDGKWIYFGSGRTGREELWKMPAAGGTPVQITHNEAHSGLESLDGKMIYFVKGRNPASLWAMPVAGGPEVKLVDGIYRNNFEVAPKGIYFMTTQNAEGTSELRFYSFARKSTSLIAPVGVPDYGFDLSPDGRFIAYAQVDRLSTQLMMIENFH